MYVQVLRFLLAWNEAVDSWFVNFFRFVCSQLDVHVLAVTFNVLGALNIKIAAFWDVMQCLPIDMLPGVSFYRITRLNLKMDTSICWLCTVVKNVKSLQTSLFTSIGKKQSNTTFNICIANRFLYIACLNNYMFRGLYLPSSGCTLYYYKANYRIYNVFVFGKKISCASIKFAFKIITVAVELKCYSNMKGINSIKCWVLWSRDGEYGVKFYRCARHLVDKTKNIVYCIVCYIMRKCTTWWWPI